VEGEETQRASMGLGDLSREAERMLLSRTTARLLRLLHLLGPCLHLLPPLLLAPKVMSGCLLSVLQSAKPVLSLRLWTLSPTSAPILCLCRCPPSELRYLQFASTCRRDSAPFVALVLRLCSAESCEQCAQTYRMASKTRVVDHVLQTSRQTKPRRILVYTQTESSRQGPGDKAQGRGPI
jgi:hypothetical protein